MKRLPENDFYSRILSLFSAILIVNFRVFELILFCFLNYFAFMSFALAQSEVFLV